MIHEILLSVEVVILEGLVLKQVKPGQYFRNVALEMGRTERFSGKTGADIRRLTGIKNQTWGL